MPAEALCGFSFKYSIPCAMQQTVATNEYLRGSLRMLQLSSESDQFYLTERQPLSRDQMGIEGFIETVAQEVAPFNIEFTIVESGPTRMNSGGGLVNPPMAVYEDSRTH